MRKAESEQRLFILFSSERFLLLPVGGRLGGTSIMERTNAGSDIPLTLQRRREFLAKVLALAAGASVAQHNRNGRSTTACLLIIVMIRCTRRCARETMQCRRLCEHELNSSAMDICTSRTRPDQIAAGIARLAFALIAAALLMACATPGTDSTSIKDSRWNMTRASFGMPGGGVTPTLEFRGGRVFAHSGCNRASGTYQDRNGTIAIDALMSTKMGCRDTLNQFEIRYYKLLSANPVYRIDADTLTVAADGDSAGFTRAGAPVSRIIEVAPMRVDCVGVAKMSCLQWREKPGEPWRRHYGDIAGFIHEAGTTYRLRIREEPV